MAIFKFQKPDKVIMIDSNKHEGKFEFRPLEPGYGLTIGNALRRVLLASLEGFAITSLKIDNIEHEFTTIPGVVDNWDLSVKRATSVVRILQNSYGVDPTKLVAAGRSFYMPIADNDSSVTRAVNRRTRIVVLPKLDQFTKLIEEGMSMNVPATGPSDTISSDNKPD